MEICISENYLLKSWIFFNTIVWNIKMKIQALDRKKIYTKYVRIVKEYVKTMSQVFEDLSRIRHLRIFEILKSTEKVRWRSADSMNIQWRRSVDRTRRYKEYRRVTMRSRGWNWNIFWDVVRPPKWDPRQTWLFKWSTCTIADYALSSHSAKNWFYVSLQLSYSQEQNILNIMRVRHFHQKKKRNKYSTRGRYVPCFAIFICKDRQVNCNIMIHREENALQYFPWCEIRHKKRSYQ